MASVKGTSSITIKGIMAAELVPVAVDAAGAGVFASGCLSFVAGAGVAGGLLAATTGVSATLLTVESFGAALVAGAASVAVAAGVAAASAGAGLAGCAELSLGAGVAPPGGESFRAKAAPVKASKRRVINRLSFDFMCLVSFWR